MACYPTLPDNPFSERKVFDHPDRLLTIGQVAELTGLTVGSLYHYVSQKRIPAIRLSRRCLRFRLSDLQGWFEEAAVYPARERSSRSER